MKATALATALAFGIATWGGTQAHQGHKHPDEMVVGTVVQVHHTDTITHIEVKTPNGDTVVLTADHTTKYTKGTAATTLAEIKPGLRIVAKVTGDGAVTMASEITLGVMDPGAEYPQAKDHGQHHQHDHEH